MRAWSAAVFGVAAIVSGGLTGCSQSAANAAGLRVGDCLRVGGTAERPQATKVACGSSASNFKVVATVAGEADRGQCPADVDSSYSMRNVFSNNTACLDIDWVVGGCMSVDPDNNTDPVRVDCSDRSVPHRQRATEILNDLKNPVSADLCASGVGYAYAERRFVVCVEDIGSPGDDASAHGAMGRSRAIRPAPAERHASVPLGVGSHSGVTLVRAPATS
jgi:hypothetical protein